MKDLHNVNNVMYLVTNALDQIAKLNAANVILSFIIKIMGVMLVVLIV